MEDDFGAADGNDSIHSAGSKSFSIAAESKSSMRDQMKEKDVLKDEIYDSIQEALLGTTVIEVPRVSRETIISVLQTHTDLIKGLRKDNILLHARVSAVHSDTKENEKQIKLLQDGHEKAKKDLSTLFRHISEFRKEMEELSEKVSELYVVKKHLAEQKQFVDGLHADFTKFSAEVNEFMVDTNSFVTNVKTAMTETQFIVKELKQYVDHFGDNLILSSSQITVDPQLGFSSKPISLSDTLKQCSNNFRHFTEKTEDHDENIVKILHDLDTKAPDSILVNVNTLEKKVHTIEVHLQKEEEVGIGAIRKNIEELNNNVNAITTEMTEKVDRDNVNIIVHEKYEEIVQYLQDALQSSLEDENNFKRKADEISDLVATLSNNKADRSEINNMQELMVKSEALMKKLGNQMNIKDRLKDFISKKDLDNVLQEKVDRAEFEQQVQNITTNARKSKKLAPVGQPYPAPVEDAIRSRPNTIADNFGSAGQGFDAAKKMSQSQSLTHFPVIALGKGIPNEQGKANSDSLFPNRSSSPNQFGNNVKSRKTADDSNDPNAPLNAAGFGPPGSADRTSLSDSIDDLGISNNGSSSPNQFSNYVKNKKAAAGVAEQYGNSSPGTFKMGAESVGRLGTAGNGSASVNLSVASASAGDGGGGGNRFNKGPGGGGGGGGGGASSGDGINGGNLEGGFGFGGGRGNGQSNGSGGAGGGDGLGYSGGGGVHGGQFGGTRGNGQNNGFGGTGGGNGGFGGVGGANGVNLGGGGVGRGNGQHNGAGGAGGGNGPASGNGVTGGQYGVGGGGAGGRGNGIGGPNGANSGGGRGGGGGGNANSSGKASNSSRINTAGRGGPSNNGEVDGYGRTEFPYVPAPPYVLDYPEQSALNDSLGFMKGPIIGGQFNVYPSKLHRKAPINSKPVVGEDVEGKGLMLKGNDGHFYYTDKDLKQ